MPPKMGLRVSSCFHNAFSAVDCQEISGRFWPKAVIPLATQQADIPLLNPTGKRTIILPGREGWENVLFAGHQRLGFFRLLDSH
ncbi:hypothetical protein RTE98_09250 [Stutzerimonas frequens]|uniref:hypothetical protein n=1 Tax=Stutzerimonas frequens TaxID=2968969 RepID=UPI002934F3B7|nr:hypothetical protein [Stutzerimonas frequens]WOC80699.1 hypothetical protein RTE98_09250 [Stutzerimonas frequens]